MEHRFPHLRDWASGCQKIRMQRNKSAHGCGVSPTFLEDKGSQGHEGFRRPFDAAEFWDTIIADCIPAMQDEPNDLRFLLWRDLPSTGELPTEEPSFIIEAVPAKSSPLPLPIYIPFLLVGLYFLSAVRKIYSAVFPEHNFAYQFLGLMRRIIVWPIKVALQTLDDVWQYNDAGYQKKRRISKNRCGLRLDRKRIHASDMAKSHGWWSKGTGEIGKIATAQRGIRSGQLTRHSMPPGLSWRRTLKSRAC